MTLGSRLVQRWLCRTRAGAMRLGVPLVGERKDKRTSISQGKISKVIRVAKPLNRSAFLAVRGACSRIKPLDLLLIFF